MWLFVFADLIRKSQTVPLRVAVWLAILQVFKRFPMSLFFVRINVYGVFFDSKPTSEIEAENLRAEIEKFGIGVVSVEAA
jgi:hypothetical protein